MTAAAALLLGAGVGLQDAHAAVVVEYWRFLAPMGLYREAGLAEVLPRSLIGFE